MGEHFIFGREASWGVYKDSNAIALPVRSANIQATQPLMRSDETGRGRAARPGAPGEVGVAGPIATLLNPRVVPLFLRAWLGSRTKLTGGVTGTTTLYGSSITAISASATPTVTTAAAHGFAAGDKVYLKGTTSTPSQDGLITVTSVPSATTFVYTAGATVTGAQAAAAGSASKSVGPVYRNLLLPDDNVAYDSFSAQQKYLSDLSLALKGLKVGGFNIGANAREFATCGVDFVGKDAALAIAADLGVPVNSIGTGASPLVTTGSAHGLVVGDKVYLSGTNAVPAQDGLYTVATTPLATTFTYASTATVTGAGTAAGYAAIGNRYWTDGTTVAPTVLSGAQYVTMPEDFKFYQGVMRLGGTVAIGTGTSAGELVVTGGVDQVDFDSIELAVALNLSEDAYGVNWGDRTRQSVPEGARDITVRFSPEISRSKGSFWQAWKAGTSAVVQLHFRSSLIAGIVGGTPIYHELVFTMPHVTYGNGPLPEINRSFGLKRFTVEGTAEEDPNLGYDIGVVAQVPEDLTVNW